MTVLEFLENQPSAISELFYAAHDYLLEALPNGGSSVIKWKIPFYQAKGLVCYINPHKNHITIGFPAGYKLVDESGILLGANEKLKQVRYVEIRKIEDLYSEDFNIILQQALLLDSERTKGRTWKI
jgi:hypothetical protein